MSKYVPLVSVCFAVAGTTVLSCSQQTESPSVDPKLGRECFEYHRSVLPPGSQYEGFEAFADEIRVKVMTGTELETFRCVLSPDGTLDPEESAKGN